MPVIGHRGLQVFVMSRTTHFLENQLTDGAEVISLKRRPRVSSQKYIWYPFLLQAVKPRTY
jgi:hypothetical protein